MYVIIQSFYLCIMKIFTRILIFTMIVTVMSGCAIFYPSPVTTEIPENNRSYQVDYLFEHDGCKVYRFYDMGHYVYFTNCNGEATSILNDSSANMVTNAVRITYDNLNTIEKNVE